MLNISRSPNATDVSEQMLSHDMALLRVDVITSVSSQCEAGSLEDVCEVDIGSVCSCPVIAAS